MQSSEGRGGLPDLRDGRRLPPVAAMGRVLRKTSLASTSEVPMSLSINALRHRAAAACAAALALAATSAHAVTVKVGPSAGLPDSNCQFDSVQAAIDSLPEDNAQHVIELEARDYLDDSATFVVAGRSVRVATRYEQFSGCTLPI